VYWKGIAQLTQKNQKMKKNRHQPMSEKGAWCEQKNQKIKKSAISRGVSKKSTTAFKKWVTIPRGLPSRCFAFKKWVSSY